MMNDFDDSMSSDELFFEFVLGLPYLLHELR